MNGLWDWGGLFRWCLRWSQSHTAYGPPCSAKFFFLQFRTLRNHSHSLFSLALRELNSCPPYRYDQLLDKHKGFGVKQTWIQILVPLLPCYTTLGKLCFFFSFFFLVCFSWDTGFSNTHFIRFQGELYNIQQGNHDSSYSSRSYSCRVVVIMVVEDTMFYTLTKVTTKK